MIYHLLRGNVLHTTPLLVRGIMLHAEEISPRTIQEHYYCITMFGKKMQYKNVDENPYDKICKEMSFTRYRFFYSKWSYLWFLLTRKTKDKIIFHGNEDKKIHLLTNILLLIFRPGLLNRISLICWGNNDFIRGGRLLTKMTLGPVRAKSYAHYMYIIALSSEDKKEIQELYPKADVVYCPYMGSPKKLDRRVSSVGNKVKVMVSHSGWPDNHHMKSFELLKKYIPNVSVVCPLCYGNNDYIQQVIKAGRDIFHEDFDYFTDLKPKKEYEDLIKEMDVFITAAERQTGLAALFNAMLRGVRIYVTGNILRSIRNDGYIINDLSEIDNMDFKHFSEPVSDEEANHNLKLYNEKRCNGEGLKEGWRKIYEY